MYCPFILLRSVSVSEVTQFSANQNLGHTFDILEDVTAQDYLLLLTSVGLFRATNSGTTETLIPWSPTAKYDLMSIYPAKLCPSSTRDLHL